MGRGKAFRVALCGICAAGACALLWIAAVLPSGRLGFCAAAGLFPAAAVLQGGPAAGYLTWAVSALAGLLLVPDKGLALLYLAFLGVYPVVKWNIESLRRLPLEWLIKLVFFNGVLTLFWFALRSVLAPLLPKFLAGTLAVYVAGNLVFVLYDIGLTGLISFISSRLHPRRR